MLNFLKNSQKKLEKIFNDKNIFQIQNKSSNNSSNTLLYINSRVVVWKKEEDEKEFDYCNLFNKQFNDNYKVLNFSNNVIPNFTDVEKITYFKVPQYPAYTLQFILEFALTIKDFIDNDDKTIFIFYDDITSPRILLLISTALSYGFTNNQTSPIIILANILSNNMFYPDVASKQYLKNLNRYLNYFERIKNSPMLKYKKYYLSSIVINGAPAISHPNNSDKSIYISIDSKSFYCPVIRIVSHGKMVFSSFDPEKEQEVINYSAFNSAKFNINKHIFGDTIIEVLHYSNKKFKQLFLIQFNTLFTDISELTRFTKDDIDGVCKDIRYPNEFYIDLFYDNSQVEEISVYEEYINSWKSSLSKFIYHTISGSSGSQEKNKNSKNGSFKNTSDNDLDNEMLVNNQKINIDTSNNIYIDSNNKSKFNTDKNNLNKSSSYIKSAENIKNSEEMSNETKDSSGNESIKDSTSQAIDINNIISNDNKELLDTKESSKSECEENNKKDNDNEEEDEDLDAYLKSLESRA